MQILRLRLPSTFAGAPFDFAQADCGATARRSVPATILRLRRTIICNQAEQSIVLAVERKLQESRSLYLVRINPMPG